jgi:nuclear GTP-binding protein
MRLLVLVSDALLIIVAKMVINDFLRGKLPWYISDPNWPERKGKEEEDEFDGTEGKLGEKRNILALEAGGDNSLDEEDEGTNESTETSEKEDNVSHVEKSADGQSEARSADGGEDRIKDTRPLKKMRRE